MTKLAVMRGGGLCAFSPLFSLYLHAADIRDFGARGNGVTDDTVALQKAIDQTPVGGILTFSTGTYVLTSLLLRSNRTYQGQNGPVLLGYRGKGAGAHFLANAEYNRTCNISTDGIVLNGGGVSYQGREVPAVKVSFTRNTIPNIVNSSPGWPLRSGMYIPSGMTLCTIANHSFLNSHCPAQARVRSGVPVDRMMETQTVHFAPVTTVVHVGGLSTKTRSAEMPCYLSESTRRLYRKHAGGFGLPRLMSRA